MANTSQSSSSWQSAHDPAGLWQFGMFDADVPGPLFTSQDNSYLLSSDPLDANDIMEEQEEYGLDVTNMGTFGSGMYSIPGSIALVSFSRKTISMEYYC